jgi:DNA polymerase III delta prime subunit
MHHANLLIGTRDWALDEILPSERLEGPDVMIYHFDRMSVVHARSLVYETGLRPIVRPYRTFILSCDSLLHEAQNTLLKLFEEPNNHTVFYLIIPREDMLLPTLRSRLNLLGTEERKRKREAFEIFVKAGYAHRLTMISEKLGAEDTVWMNEVIQGLAEYAHAKKDALLIRDVLMLESYIYMSGSSKKNAF